MYVSLIPLPPHRLFEGSTRAGGHFKNVIRLKNEKDVSSLVSGKRNQKENTYAYSL